MMGGAKVICQLLFQLLFQRCFLSAQIGKLMNLLAAFSFTLRASATLCFISLCSQAIEKVQ